MTPALLVRCAAMHLSCLLCGALLAGNATAQAQAGGRAELSRPGSYGQIQDEAAPDFDFGVSTRVGRSDNITLSPQNTIDETIAAAVAGLSLNHSSRRVRALSEGSLAYVEYLNDTFDNEVIGNVLLDSALFLAPERLSWVLQDNYGQIRRTASVPVTPDNREDTNYFTTGPDIVAPFGTRTSLHVSGRYSDVYYEDSDLGNEELSGVLALVRALTRASSISLNASVSSVAYDVPSVAEDYDEYEGYLRYQIEAARTSLLVDLGYTELQFDNLRDSDNERVREDGYLARLNLIRRLGPASMLWFEAGREFSNSADLFRQLQQTGATDTSTQPIEAVAGPLVSTYGRLEWEFAFHRTQFGAGVAYYDEDYERNDSFDGDNTIFHVRAGRDVNRSLTARVEVNHRRESLDESARDFSETIADLVLDWRLGRRIYTSLQYRWMKRVDDVPSSEFQEDQLWFLFGYSRSGRGSWIGESMIPGAGQTVQ
jgi:hypothetical protein